MRSFAVDKDCMYVVYAQDPLLSLNIHIKRLSWGLSVGAYWGISRGYSSCCHIFLNCCRNRPYFAICCQSPEAICCRLPNHQVAAEIFLIVASCGQKPGNCCELRPNFYLLRVAGYLNTTQVSEATSPSACALTLFNLFMSLVSNVVNTDDIIEVIFPRWRTYIEAQVDFTPIFKCLFE